MAGSPTIVIAGAGIGGLTAALSLAAIGAKIIVLERAVELADVGAGIQLAPNASRILIDLGLRDRLAQKAVTPNVIRIHSLRAGGLVAEIPLDRAEARFGTPYWVIHRADLQSTLLEAVRANPAITLHLGADIANVETSARGVTVTVAAGTSSLTGDGMIGADGVWSKTRLRLLGGALARQTGRVAYRTTIPIEQAPPFARRATGLWLAPDMHLVHYPVRAGRELNIVVIANGAPPHDGWSHPAASDEVAKLIDRRWSALAAFMPETPAAWTKWPLAVVDGEFSWRRGPIALLGDAAHAMLPFAAQGGAMAIEDAAVLAREVAGASGLPTAFDRYERARRPRVDAVRRLTNENGRIYHLGGAMAIARDTALRLAPSGLLLDRQAWVHGWRL